MSCPPSFLSIPDAIPSADQVRITPSLRSQRGSVWTKNRVNFEHWEAEVTFRVSGRGRMGADGLVRRPEVSVLLIEAVVECVIGLQHNLLMYFWSQMFSKFNLHVLYCKCRTIHPAQEHTAYRIYTTVKQPNCDRSIKCHDILDLLCFNQIFHSLTLKQTFLILD